MSGYIEPEVFSCGGMPMLFTCDTDLYMHVQSVAGLQGKMFYPAQKLGHSWFIKLFLKIDFS